MEVKKLDSRFTPMELVPGSLFFRYYSFFDNQDDYEVILDAMIILDKWSRRAFTEGCPQIEKFLYDTHFRLWMLLDSLETTLEHQKNKIK